MKKKGFTLIELLAVIVILALIALIATPLVLKYIEKSRKESKVDSAYSFVRNLETEIANFSIKNNGKKYNGQPTDKGYYELESFNDSEIDTTVKGDKPNSIKVCLSSLGQVEKAMFEYGKYYVSYDGKKGSISDKDTYDNFSCSGNVAGGVENNIIFNSQMNFTLDDEISIGLPSDPNDANSINFVAGKNYQLTMKQNGSIFKDILITSFEDNMAMYTSDNNYPFILSVEDGNFQIEAYFEEIDGTYEVEIKESLEPYIPYVFRIDSGGTSWLYSTEFIEGVAQVLITDNEGTEYCDKSINFREADYNLVGEMSYGNSDDLGDLDNVYGAIQNGKIITITVTQNGVVKTIGGTVPKFQPNYSAMNGGNTYYWGNSNISTSA